MLIAVSTLTSCSSDESEEITGVQSTEYKIVNAIGYGWAVEWKPVALNFSIDSTSKIEFTEQDNLIAVTVTKSNAPTRQVYIILSKTGNTYHTKNQTDTKSSFDFTVNDGIIEQSIYYENNLANKIVFTVSK